MIGLGVLALSGGVVAQVPCTSSDPTTNTATCPTSAGGSVSFNLNELCPSGGCDQPFLVMSADQNYWYYFKITGTGLPDTAGAMQHCTLDPTPGGHFAAAQAADDGSGTCYPLGKQAAQTWMY